MTASDSRMPTGPTVPPSGEQYEISGGGYRAVVTECGAGLRQLERDGQALLDGFALDEPAASGRGQLMMPWPNRIKDGAYSFDGRPLQLPLSEPARSNASHGLTRWVAWSVREHTPEAVTLAYRLMAQTGYPWTVDLEVRYDMSAAGLTVTVAAVNRSPAPAPYAQGAHPYLTVGDDLVDAWELVLPASTRVPVDERGIPTGREAVDGTPYDFRTGARIGELVVDHPFTDLDRGADGRAEVLLRHPASGRTVTLWMDDAYRWVQVFTGDTVGDRARRGLAVEPMTAPPNAFRTGEGLLVLGPAGADDTHTSSWGIR